jgi:hypothetical protein
MKQNEMQEFTAIMNRAAMLTAHRKDKDWDMFLEIMFEELINHDLEDVRRVVAEHVRTEKFFPMLADIIQPIEKPLVTFAEERAERAWALVLNAVRKLGGWHSVSFPSPAHIYALEQMGGWRQLCATMLDSEIQWREKNFIAHYIAGERCASWENEEGKVRVPRYCVGTLEAQNRDSGHSLPAVLNAATGKPDERFRSMELPANLEMAHKAALLLEEVSERLNAS